eukprot:TRINITY_DN8752_c0_g1_i2.p1 TRINITY_DN8752_c0_g1~~TRINITY_DN8752_c0_g1_i2.p1  ORF type:complete len:392 (+),score=43.06 TRINITY_DN8752_c0_g1_i2:124-1299(+)
MCTHGPLLEGELAPPGNYLPEACPGCIIVHETHPLILGMQPASASQPSFQWDRQSKVFTVVNCKDFVSFTYITFCDQDILDKHGQPFEAGKTRNEFGAERSAVTFVVVVPPATAMLLGRVEVPLGRLGASADLYLMELERLLPPAFGGISDGADDGKASALPPPIGFPLPDDAGPYLCTQGVGGHLTHFFPESFYAVDLRCPCGTPVLSAGDGTVSEVRQSHRCGGIHAANLAAWNSISVRLDCGVVVEYLHTMPDSAAVRAGDRVVAGQILCHTGDIGFAPEPHLHVELHGPDDPNGPALPLRFRGGRDGTFVPVAGRWYLSSGEANEPRRRSDSNGAASSSPVDPAPPPAHRHHSHMGASTRELCCGLRRFSLKAGDTPRRRRLRFTYY